MKKKMYESKFVGRKQKFYCESFDNYEEFLRTLEKRKGECYEYTEERMNESISWRGANLADSKRMLKDGWEEPVKELKNGLIDLSRKAVEKTSFKPIASVAGFIPIIPNALMGQPNAMIDMKRYPKKSKILNFVIVIDRASSNSAEQIKKRMVEQLGAIQRFEQQGYRCRISVTFLPFDTFHYDIHPFALVKIKDEGQLFDIKRLAFPICHSAMLRTLMFHWVGSLASKDSDVSDVIIQNVQWGSLGKAYEYWGSSVQEEMQKGMTENLGLGKTIVLGFHDTLESMQSRVSENV